MNKILIIIALAVALISCENKKTQIVSRDVLLPYLDTTKIHRDDDHIEADMKFWRERGPESTISLIKLASLYASRFKTTSDINDIHISDSLYERVLVTENQDASLMQSMAENAITQHQFWKANDFLTRALEIGNNKSATYLMMADVQLELGNIKGASKILKDFKNKSSFAWLIRNAKVKDHEGKIDSAILSMERALERIAGNKSLYCWTKSNLADMYGHAGRVQESYNAYVEVLKVQPEYDYALKGIAWVAFSNDHNPALAKEILQFIKLKKNSPDVYLQLAEIATFENDIKLSKQYLKLFTDKARDRRYGEMYNAYIAAIEADDFMNADASLSIALREISNRPTPLSYDMKAWALYRQGKYTEALDLATSFVEGKTFEPQAAYHLGMIYKANQQNDKAKEYLEQAMESSFELGPVKMIEIKKQMKS